MAQRLKEDVRQRILSAALQTFAEAGYLGTKLATIAERADIATSNLYKYFSSKEALFDAVVRPEHAATLLRRLRARLEELRSLDDWMNSDVGVSAAAAALLDLGSGTPTDADIARWRCGHTLCGGQGLVRPRDAAQHRASHSTAARRTIADGREADPQEHCFRDLCDLAPA
ncbi:TetR/AcrR family transcriptional regulator [Rhizobium sp. BK377]|uniref:TetR/AcrR family transcriptional regulator n=1 Tax=Rhizobium sp. BK377 TaxID=2587058 RepID=UPI00160C768F|nr:helix-turn-helix domain-containing protein [Rhizobium sp. BK377]MBB3464281.1 AcrR family transcriptional regulator [Rhizobium sp. BK377]